MVACKENGVDIKPSQEIVKERFSKNIYCIELDMYFNSWHEAARYLYNNCYTTNKSITSIGKNITRSCKDLNGKASAYKMHWKYI